MTRLLSVCVLLALALVAFAGGKHYDEHIDDQIGEFDSELDDETVQHFHRFAAQFEKAYDTEEEKTHRMKVFKKNLQRIQFLNDNEQGSAKYGVTKFADFTPQEVAQLHARDLEGELARDRETEVLDEDAISEEVAEALFDENANIPELELSDSDEDDEDDVSDSNDATSSAVSGYDDSSSDSQNDLDARPTAEQSRLADREMNKAQRLTPADKPKQMPKIMDWRKYGAVSRVREQGHCGACWAFSTVGAMEGAVAVNTNKLYTLSEQYLVDCDNDNHGCHGGAPVRAMKYIVKHGGAFTEQAYPYQAAVGRCKQRSTKLRDSSRVLAGLNKWARIKPDERLMAKALYKYGPMSFALHGRGWLHFYHGGIARPLGCPHSLTHGVILVGYGEENGQQYWILKNSWGPVFGEQGYFRLARGSNACGCNKMVNVMIKDKHKAKIRGRDDSDSSSSDSEW